MNDLPHNSTIGRQKALFLVLGIIVATAASSFYFVYHAVYGNNIILKQDITLTIPSNCSVETLCAILDQKAVLKNTFSFKLCAGSLMSYTPKAGKYRLTSSLRSNRQLIQKLRGSQLSIKLTFHNFRKKEQLAAYVGSRINTDSSEIMAILDDAAFLESYGYTKQNVLSLFIPNTYEVYWNCTAIEFWKRMLEEHQRFWNEDRMKKAETLSLSPAEVYTLASIVESESQYKPERRRIAGVYVNRLRKPGWKLEADPTVVYAVGDFGLKRVLNIHLETDSPYNTYKYAGLPPGPIYMASIHSIDAVLNFEQHDYMFFCAKPKEAGISDSHAFAKTHRKHINNAKKYWRWLRSQ
jgi:UPF0755 protein